ncbi:hypothetical protein HY095_06125 [Candidatus Micrarchaeota archaeon]|nr:hypothetical protein [Candidatus Micrarchaeota archaeon]
MPGLILPHSRAQSSVEYLSIIGVQLVVLAIIWIYLNSSLQSSQRAQDVAKAQNAVDKIRDSAQVVSLQGPPAKQTIEIDLPSNIKSFNFSNGHEALIVLDYDKGVDVSAYSPVLLEGNVTYTASGPTLFYIFAQKGKVLVSD